MASMTAQSCTHAQPDAPDHALPWCACRPSPPSPRCSSTRPTRRPGRSGPRSRAPSSPRTRRTPPTPTRPTRCAAAASRWPRTPRARSPTTPWRAPTSSSSPTARTRAGSASCPAARRSSPPPSSTRSSASSPRGGGLLVLGECEQEKYGNRLNDLLARFGIHLANDTVSDYDAHHRRAALGPGRPRGPLPATCRARDAPASTAPASSTRCPTARGSWRAPPRRPRRPARRCSPSPSTARAASSCWPTPTSSATTAWASSTTRTCCASSSTGPPARASPHAAAPVPPRRRRGPGAGTRCARRPTRCACSRQPDGALAPDADRDRAGAHVDGDGRRAIEALAARFAHQADYLAATVGDLRAWAAGGFAEARLHGARSSASAPTCHRVDGIEHLVVFPMYMQNGSRDTGLRGADRPRALAGVAGRARARPLRQREVRPGRRSSTTPPATTSECAVLFPETVSVRRAPAPTTSARSSATARRSASARVGGAAARPAARSNLPPDAAALLASARAVAATPTMLWDLVHDRAHSHGDLPFDPFMIRQRMPYWMYALEELRCDLTAFVEAVDAGARGLRLRPPRPVRDPLRPAVPLPGHGHARAQLRRPGRPAAVRLPAPPRPAALDRQPLTHRVGRRVADGVAALRAAVRGALPRRHRPLEARAVGRGPRLRRRLRPGRDRLAVGPGRARPSPRSRTRGRTSTRSADDEFPLSMFYTQLKGKLAPALDRPARAEQRASWPHDPLGRLGRRA